MFNIVNVQKKKIAAYENKTKSSNADDEPSPTVCKCSNISNSSVKEQQPTAEWTSTPFSSMSSHSSWNFHPEFGLSSPWIRQNVNIRYLKT